MVCHLLHLNEMYLNTWALAGGAVFGKVMEPLGGSSLLEEVQHWSWGGL